MTCCADEQSYVLDPMGIAVNHYAGLIYWLDKMSTSNHHTVLRSCATDGTRVVNVKEYSKVAGHTFSGNTSDLIIDFFHNNTAFFVDTVGRRVARRTNPSQLAIE